MNDCPPIPVFASPHARAAELLIREALDFLKRAEAETQDLPGLAAPLHEVKTALNTALETLRPKDAKITLGFALPKWLSDTRRQRYLRQVDTIDTLVQRNDRDEALTQTKVLLAELLELAEGKTVSGWTSPDADGWTGQIQSFHLPALGRFTIADINVILRRGLKEHAFRLHQLSAPGNPEAPIIRKRSPQ